MEMDCKINEDWYIEITTCLTPFFFFLLYLHSIRWEFEHTLFEPLSGGTGVEF